VLRDFLCIIVYYFADILGILHAPTPLIAALRDTWGVEISSRFHICRDTLYVFSFVRDISRDPHIFFTCVETLSMCVECADIGRDLHLFFSFVRDISRDPHIFFTCVETLSMCVECADIGRDLHLFFSFVRDISKDPHIFFTLSTYAETLSMYGECADICRDLHLVREGYI